MFPDEDLNQDLRTRERFFTPFLPRDDERESGNSLWESMLESIADDFQISSFDEGERDRKISCSYGPKSKDQLDCLEQAWNKEGGVEIEITPATERHVFPRMVEVKVPVSKSQLQREYVDQLVRKVIRIGKECGCLLESFGFLDE